MCFADYSPVSDALLCILLSLQPNQASLVTSLVHVYATASSPTTTVSTLALTGNGILDLSALNYVLSL